MERNVTKDHRGSEMQKPSRGFSLIELLIVVAIILIIAAIAIPNLLRARIAANESSAVASTRTINTAQVTYQTAYPTVGYAGALSTLGPSAVSCTTPSSTNACIIDYVLAQAYTGGTSGSKSGYVFAEGAAQGSGGAGPNITFVSGAAPLSYNQSGVRRFCSAEDAVIRFDPNNGGSTTPESTEATCLGATYTVLQ
jgi:type IV pilus assembly protein PilA